MLSPSSNHLHLPHFDVLLWNQLSDSFRQPRPTESTLFISFHTHTHTHTHTHQFIIFIVTNYTYFTLPYRGLGLVGLVDWPTVVLQCFDAVGWVIWPVKIVPDMIYHVFGGTLNPTVLLLLLLLLLVLIVTTFSVHYSLFFHCRLITKACWYSTHWLLSQTLGLFFTFLMLFFFSYFPVLTSCNGPGWLPIKFLHGSLTYEQNQ